MGAKAQGVGGRTRSGLTHLPHPVVRDPRIGRARILKALDGPCRPCRPWPGLDQKFVQIPTTADVSIVVGPAAVMGFEIEPDLHRFTDRKSTRLNSSHVA